MHRLGALALALAATACAVPSIDYADLDRALAVAKCERLVACGVFSSLDECARITPTRPDLEADTASAIAAGKIEYHGDYARQCVDASAALTCDATTHAARAQPQACAFMYEGKLAAGTACNLDSECASRRCDLPPDAMCDEAACCPGTCGALEPGAAGETCTRTIDCADGNYCASDLTCHAVGTDGAGCIADYQCAIGLVCALGACRAPGTSGGDCQFGRCANVGEFCDQASSTCQPLIAAGRDCGQSDACADHGACINGKCLAPAARGQSCALTRCDPTSRCDPDSKQCGPLLENSMPCESGADCASGTCKPGPVFDACTAPPLCD